MEVVFVRFFYGWADVIGGLTYGYNCRRMLYEATLRLRAVQSLEGKGGQSEERLSGSLTAKRWRVSLDTQLDTPTRRRIE